jgi:cysteine synthase
METRLPGYRAIADEVWHQTGGRIDGLVQSVGPAGSIRAVGESLRRRDARIRIVAVEPMESAVRSGGPTDAPEIDGIGAGFIVPRCRGGAGAPDRAGVDAGRHSDAVSADSR